MTKKLISLLLALSLMLCLCACEKKDNAEDQTEIATEKATDEPTVTEEPTEEPTEDEEIATLRGTVDGQTYRNETINLGCELGSDWVIYDEATLAQLMGLTTDLMNNDTYTELINNGGTVFDFYATRADGANMNITISTNSNALIGLMSEEMLVDSYVATAGPTLEAAGFENVEMQKETVTFAGEEHYCVAISATLNGIALFERQAFFATADYVYAITTCAYNTDESADLLNAFYALEG